MRAIFRVSAILSLCVVAPLLAAKNEAFPGIRRKWQYYQSPNFELYSAGNNAESREILANMEQLRALCLETFQLPVRVALPVTIYYFNDEDDFDAYKPAVYRGNSEFVGFCSNFADRSVITMAPARDRKHAREVAYHEYVHYLFRIAEQTPAPWFDEGVAELFSTLEEHKGWIHLGDPVVGRVTELHQFELMPFEDLFAVRRDSSVFKDRRQAGVFYAQSWALVHYCYFGVNKVPPDKMKLFIRIAGSPRVQESPAEFRAAVKDLLGFDYPQLKRELERYVHTGSFLGRKAPLPKIPGRETYTVRPAPADEMYDRLAELAVRINDVPQANLALRLRVEQKDDARLREVLGHVAFAKNDLDTAKENWERAVELGTSNPAIFRELSRIESNLLFSQFNLDYRLPPARGEKVRKLLLQSIEHAPEQSMGYEMLAWVEATSAEPVIANVNRVQARFNSLNDKPRTLIALALVRLRLGNETAALQLLDSLPQLEPSDWALYCAEVMRARIENRAIDPTKFPRGAGARMPLRLPTVDLPH